MSNEDSKFFKIDRGRARLTMCSELWVTGGTYLAGTSGILKVNREGFFIGDKSFTSAPFSIDYGGNMIANDATITGDFTLTTGSIITGDVDGYQVKITDGKVSFLKSGTEKSFIKTNTNGGITISSSSSVYFTDLSGHNNAELDENSNLKFSSDAYISWASGRKLTASGSKITCDGDFVATRGIGVGSGQAYSVGGSQGQTWAEDMVSDVWVEDGNKIKYNTIKLTFSGGILTNKGSKTSHTAGTIG